MATDSGDVDVSKIDLYEFLGLAQGPAASAKEINRAGRQTSFKYHPDKVDPTAENLENFHIAQIAVGILTDPEQKSKYDQQREARLRRKAEVAALDERRRRMAQDLEDRERNGMNATNVVAGQKRSFSEREMKIRAAQEANRRKVEERNARQKLETERKAAEERVQATKEQTPLAHAEQTTNGTASRSSPGPVADGETSIARSVRLRWIREGSGQGYDESTISELFSGKDLENVVLLKDKKRKVEGRGKVVMGTAVAVFVSAAAAKQVLAQKASLVDKFESIQHMDMAGKDE